MNEKVKDFIKEFLRYTIVGGSAFIIDFGAMCIFQELVFKGQHVYIAVFIGYILGLIYNFILSNSYVFKNGFEKIKGKEILSFIIFGIIGLIGLVLTELLMYLFINIIAMWYIFAKIISAGIVLFWNYLARKMIIYR